MQEGNSLSNDFGGYGRHGHMLHDGWGCWLVAEVGCPQSCCLVSLSLENELVVLLDENVVLVEGSDASGIAELAYGYER